MEISRCVISLLEELMENSMIMINTYEIPAELQEGLNVVIIHITRRIHFQ